METRNYVGELRPKIRVLDSVRMVNPVSGSVETFNYVEIEWIKGDNVSEVVFKEVIKVPENYAFLPKIAGYGTFSEKGGVLVDEENLRHFVIPVPVGILGVSNPKDN